MQPEITQPERTQWLCIDRFEGEVAVLEDTAGQVVDISRAALPQGAKAGDWLVQSADGNYAVDHAKTAQRRAEMRARVQALLQRKKQGE